MFRSMRKNAKVFYYVIAGVFIVSMGIGGVSGVFNSRPTLGKISGKKIEYSNYDPYFKQYVGNWMQQNQGKDLDDKQLKTLNDEAWERFTSKILYDKEIKRLHLKVTTQDELDRLENPADDIKGFKQFQVDGKFDNEKYQSMIKDSPQLAEAIISNIHESLPYEKLFDAIKAEVSVTDEDVKKDYVEKNDKADVKVIYFDYKKGADVKISEEDAKKYYEEHKEDYKKGPARKVKFVKFAVKPSQEDSLIAKAKIDSIYKVVIGGADFVKAAKKYSEGPSAPKGGDLGYFTANRMVKPFSAAAFSMKKGDISKPVATRFGYHIIKVYDKRKNDKGEEEVKASHILIKVEASPKTIKNIEENANKFAELAKQKGFKEATAEMNLKMEDSQEFDEKAKYVSGIGRQEDLVKFAFEHKKGDITEPLKLNEKDYVVAQISSVLGDHYTEFTKVKATIDSKLQQEKKQEAIQNQAEEFAKKHPKEQWMKMAAKEGWEIVDAKDITVTKYIAKIGKVDDLNNAIFKTEEGNFTELVKSDKGTYIAYVEKRNKPDMTKFDKEKDDLKKTMLTKKENEHINEWYKNLKEDAKIEDNRKEFYSF